jgi:hypothetical protein
MSYLRAVPNAEFLTGRLFKRIKDTDTYEQDYIEFNYKNFATDEKGIAKGEEEEATQWISGVMNVKRKHKILSSTPIVFTVLDKVFLEETGYVYTIQKLERLITSTYAQVYGQTHFDGMIPKALSLGRK